MKTRILTLAFIIVGLVAFTSFSNFAHASPVESAKKFDAPAKVAAITLPVTGSFTDALGGTGAFAGTFDIARFISRQGQILAVGTLTGTLTNSLGQVIGTVTQVIQLPVLFQQQSCVILDLELGPLDLNLLGLRVQLDEIDLLITAEPAGGLLGQLLCAIANLLNRDAPLSAIAALLNQILGAVTIP